MKSFSLKVKIHDKRPDFRVFASYFFGEDLYNYDADGDCVSPTSKDWTELYMRSRNNPDLHFKILPVSNNPLLLEVSSTSKEIVCQIAYFLAMETQGEILDKSNKIGSLDSLKEKMGDFKLQERLQIAENSIWRKATEDNPYPNLNS